VSVSGARFSGVLTSWRGRAAVAKVIGALALAPAAAGAAAGTPAGAAAQRVIATVRVGDGPSALAADPRTGAVYVVNEGSRTVKVISGRTSKVIATVAIKESRALVPWAVTVSPVTGDVYVSSFQVTSGPPVKSLPVTVISGRTNKVIATLPVNGTVSGVSPVTGDVYLTAISSGGSTSVKILSGRTNKVIATIPGASAWGMAVSPRTGEVYLPGGSVASRGSVKVLNGRTNKVAAVIQVDERTPNPQDGLTPDAIAVSPVTGEVYVANGGGWGQACTLTVLAGRTNKIINTIAVGGLGQAQLAVSRTGTVYIANNYTNTMDVISGRTNQVINTIQLGPYPGDTAFAVSQRTGNAYAFDTGTYPAIVGVSVISARTGKVTATIRLPKAVGDSYQIAVSPVTGDIYTLNPVNVNTPNPNPPWVVSVISS